MNSSTVNKPLRKHFLCTILGLLLISPNIYAQLTLEWDRTFGGEGYEEMGIALPTITGGYMFGGITTTRIVSGEVTTNTKDTVDTANPNGDYWVVKTDGNGDILWDKRFGGFKQDRLWSIVETLDGGYLIGGESLSANGADRSDTSRGDYDYWVLKLDANGNKEWDRAYGGTGQDILRKIVPLPNGQYWLAGYSNSPASFEKSTNSINGSDDFWCVKIDENGTPLGDFTYGGDDRDWLYDAELSHDGNLILAGWSSSQPGPSKTSPNFGGNDMWVVKCSTNGTMIWDASFGGNLEDVCQRLRKSSDGGYFAVGFSASDKMSGNKTADHYGTADVWIVKFSDGPTGPSIVWNTSFGGTSADFGYDIAETNFGSLLLLGESSSLTDSIGKDALLIGEKDFWAIVLEQDGTKRWEESLGGLSNDVGRFCFLAHDYGYIFGGNSNSDAYPHYKSDNNRGPSYSNDLYVIRTGCSFPPPELGDLPKLCLDDEFSLDATIPAPCPGCTYRWDDGATSPLRIVSPDVTAEYKVTVLHPDGCEMSDSVNIVVVPGPNAFKSESEPITCYGANDAAFFADSVSGSIAPPYQFSLNGGEWEDFASYTNMAPGNYTLVIRDTNGCTLDTLFNIAQPDSVIVELGPDIYVPFGDSVQLQALTNMLPDSFSFEWGQPAQLSCSDCLEPWARPFYTTTISIEVKDKNGCEAKDLLRLIVQKSDAVYIPNVFSPNLDNLNDFFTVFADKSVRRVKSLQVFDRWGELMFEQYDFQPNKEQIGWNGKFRDKWLDPAVFIYWTEVEYIDGRVELFKGDVALMK